MINKTVLSVQQYYRGLKLLYLPCFFFGFGFHHSLLGRPLFLWGFFFYLLRETLFQFNRDLLMSGCSLRYFLYFALFAISFHHNPFCLNPVLNLSARDLSALLSKIIGHLCYFIVDIHIHLRLVIFSELTHSCNQVSPREY